MNTLDKFIAVSKTFLISELDAGDIYLNFHPLDNKYSELGYNGNELKLHREIHEAIYKKYLLELNKTFLITMKENTANEILDEMSLEEKKAFFNITRDYITLNMQREEKKKTI